MVFFEINRCFLSPGLKVHCREAAGFHLCVCVTGEAPAWPGRGGYLGRVHTGGQGCPLSLSPNKESSVGGYGTFKSPRFLPEKASSLSAFEPEPAPPAVGGLRLKRGAPRSTGLPGPLHRAASATETHRLLALQAGDPRSVPASVPPEAQQAWCCGALLALRGLLATAGPPRHTPLPPDSSSWAQTPPFSKNDRWC